MSQSPLAASTQSYFVALNHALATGGFSDLRAVFSARAMLTQRSSLTRIDSDPQISTVRGRSAIIQFYRQLSADLAGSRWIVGRMNQVSPTTMVVYARTGGDPRMPSLYSIQRLVVQDRTILSADITLYYLT